MNFGFSDEQELLRAEVRKFLDQNASLEEVRKIVESPDGYSKHLWERMAELGWVGLTIPDEYGGTGLDFVTMVVLLEEAGRSLFPSPLISTVLATSAIDRLGSDEQKKRWLPGLSDGSQVGTFAFLEESDLHSAAGVQLRGTATGDGFQLDGTKVFVPDAAQSDLIVIAFRTGDGANELSLGVLEKGASGLSLTDYPSMDLTKRTGRVGCEGVQIGADSLLGSAGGATPHIEWLIDCGAMLVTAEAVGTAEAIVQITADFARERIQFGSPIGRFQAVKHPLAEMHVDTESFKSLTYYAAWAIDKGDPGASRAVSRAKAYASEVLPRMGIDGVGLHGGVGYTWEYDIQLYLKRAKWVRAAFGDADHHYARLAQQAGLDD
jgi:alkylation response protein AidB-like acyl-CoA dehydrogenase